MTRSLPPAFQDYSSYSEIHRKLAVTDQDELVRIVDWQDTGYDGTRKLVVVDADPDSVSVGAISWLINEKRLTPIGDHASSPTKAQAIRLAHAWRAGRLEQALDKATPTAEGDRRLPRL